MRFLYKGKDGGKDSTVTGYWLFEIKWLCSIVLLRFDKGSRDVYHTHSFHALSWFLKGKVKEQIKDKQVKVWSPSLKPKLTLRSCYHKVIAEEVTWCLSFRGPWNNSWKEYNKNTNIETNLTNGRIKIIKILGGVGNKSITGRSIA